MPRYVVIPCEDCIHEPEHLDDEATYGIVAWEVWCDVEPIGIGYGITGEWIDEFETEAEAQAAADRLNAEDEKLRSSSSRNIPPSAHAQ